MVKPDPLHDSHNTSTHSSHSHGPMSISTHTHHAQPPLFLPPLLSPNMLDDHDMFINGNDSGTYLSFFLFCECCVFE
jgi:hypothetical protein